MIYVIGITMLQALSSGRLDDVAVGSARHDAILHLAGGGQIMRQPHPDRQQDDRDDEPGDGASAIVAPFGFAHGLQRPIAKVLDLGS
jgi:hypothetical protein